MKQIDHLPHDAEGSMYSDLRMGRRLELDWLNGLMVRLGEEAGVPTPAYRAVMQGVHLHAVGSSKAAAKPHLLGAPELELSTPAVSASPQSLARRRRHCCASQIPPR